MYVMEYKTILHIHTYTDLNYVHDCNAIYCILLRIDKTKKNERMKY